MTERRRFFPMRTVQTDPARTVELAVQVRKETAPVAPAPVAQTGAPWVSWMPVVGPPYYNGYYVGPDGADGLVYRKNTRIFWFEGDAPLHFQEWPDVSPPIWSDDVPVALMDALPIAHEGWRCTHIKDVEADRAAVYQGVLMGAPAGAGIAWELTWDAAPYVDSWRNITVLAENSPGYAASFSGHTASAIGPVLTVCTAFYMGDTDLEMETLTAIARVGGQEVGRLVIGLGATYY